MRYKFALLVALFLSGAGCASTVSGSYVKADRETYEAVAPEYVAYIDSDTTLKPEDKAIKKRTIKSWKQRLEYFEGVAAVKSESK